MALKTPIKSIYFLLKRHRDFLLSKTLDYIMPMLHIACAYVKTIFFQNMNAFLGNGRTSQNSNKYKERNRVTELHSRRYSATLQLYEMHLVHNMWLKINISKEPESTGGIK